MSDEPDELTQDPEWLALLSGFQTHFWGQRVPAFQEAWRVARDLPPTQWSPELRRHVHGLAGVAALVGLPETGDQARRVDQQWSGADLSCLPALLQAFSEHLHALTPKTDS